MEIKELVVVRGMSETTEHTMREPTALVSVGVRLANGQVGWGDCVPDGAGVVPSFTPSQAKSMLLDVVAHVLVGQPIANARELMAEVGKLTKQMTVTERIPPPPKLTERKVSRRGFFTQLLAEDDPTPPKRPEIRRTVVTKPLDSAIQLGVNQALWMALAQSQNVPLARFLREQYALTKPVKIVPLLPDLSAVDDPLFMDTIRRKMPALIHTPTAKTGENSTILVKTMQQWQADIATHVSEKYKPAFYFRVAGALGAVHGGNAGKIFGDLFSLNTHAKSHPIYLEDPILDNTRDKQITMLVKLKGYARRRKIEVAFSAKAWVSSLADVQAYLDAGILECLHIDLCQFTHLPDVIIAVQACQSAGVKVMLSGANTPLNQTFLAHLCVATQPDWFLTNASHSGDTGLRWQYQEMLRTITQISG